MTVPWDASELHEKSSEATGEFHPGVMALFLVYDEIDKPKMMRNEMDQPTLATKIDSLKLGIVIEGHGEI